MDGIAAVDTIAAAILGVAALRGLWNGLIRESISLSTLAAACLAVWLATEPLSFWLLGQGLPLSPLAARIAAGVGVVVTTLLAGRILGGTLRSGAAAVGLGGVDRILGGALGAAEGALAVALLLLLGISILGRDHRAFEDTRTLAAYEQARAWAVGPADVASPPPE